jgi:hypothetical protein
MHEWWDPNQLNLLLAALRQLRSQRRVYLHATARGWRLL